MFEHVVPDTHFNAAVVSMATRLIPCGWDVVPDHEAPQTFEELYRRYCETGRIAVSDAHSAQTIYGDPEVNYAFRAWHDWAHIVGRFDFSLSGEAHACNLQCASLAKRYGNSLTTGRWCRLIEAEVIGQALHLKRHGAFPVDQKGFDLAWLDRAEIALERVW